MDLRPLALAENTDLLELLNHPSVTLHMPLSTGKVDESWVENWKKSKSQQWGNPEFGPWAVYLNGKFAGWSGVQPDLDDQAELAVVLMPWAWGVGRDVVDRVLASWREADNEQRRIFVYFPESRKASRFSNRLGLSFDSLHEFEGKRFERYELLKP